MLIIGGEEKDVLRADTAGLARVLAAAEQISGRKGLPKRVRGHWLRMTKLVVSEAFQRGLTMQDLRQAATGQATQVERLVADATGEERNSERVKV